MAKKSKSEKIPSAFGLKLRALIDYWIGIPNNKYSITQKALTLTLGITKQKLSSYMLKRDGKDPEPGMYLLLRIATHYDIDPHYFDLNEERPVAEFYQADTVTNLAKMLAEYSPKDLQVVSMLAMGWKQQITQLRDQQKLKKRDDFPAWLF